MTKAQHPLATLWSTAAGRRLAVLTAINLVATAVHYTHNAVFYRAYPGPKWFEPWLNLFWFVMTPSAIVGCLRYAAGRRRGAYRRLSIYCAQSLLVLTHYVVAPPSAYSLQINLTIWFEAVAALALLAYTAVLQRSDLGVTPDGAETAVTPGPAST